MAGFGRKNKNILPEEPPEVKSGGSTAIYTKTIAILGDLAYLNAYKGVKIPQLGLISGKMYLFCHIFGIQSLKKPISRQICPTFGFLCLSCVDWNRLGRTILHSPAPAGRS